MANLDIGNLQAKLTMDTSEFQKGVTTTKNELASLGTSLKSLALPIAAIGTAAVAAAGIAFKAFADFEKGMAEVFTLIPDASAEMRESMVADAKKIAKEMGVLPEKVVPALYQAISAGVPSESVFSFIEVATKASIAGVTDLTVAVDGITSVVNAYGDSVISAAEASDLMFVAVKLGKTNFEQLSASLFNVIPTASALGVEFGNVTAAIAALTAQGTPTSVATTQIRQLLVELSKSGTQASKTFEQLAGQSFQKFIANGNDLQDALQIMEDYAGNADISMMDLFGSVEAGNAAIGLTGKGTDKFSSALAEMANAAGATETAFETMEETASRRMEKLYARASVLLLDLGGAVAPVANEILNVVESVGDWFDANSEAIFLPLTNALSDVTAALGAVGEWWKGGGGEGVFTAIGDAARWLSETFAPFVEMYNKFWGEQAAKMTDFWETDGATIIQALENIRAVFQILIEQLAEWWAWLWPYMEGIYGPAMDILLDLVGVFAALFAGDWEKLGERLVDLTLSIMDLVYGVFALGFDLIIGGAYAFGNAIIGVMVAAMNGVLGAIESALNAAVDMINGIIKAMNEVPGVSIPLVGKVSFARVTAPTIEAPKLSELTGGKTPSELIREALGIEVSEEEAITPETVPTTTAPTTTGAPARVTPPTTAAPARVTPPTTAAPASTATPTAAAPTITTTTEAATETATVATTTAVDLSEITAGLAALSPAPVVEAIWELKDALVGMLSETRVVDGEVQATSIAAMLAHVGAALAASPLDVANILPDVPVSRVGEDAIAGGDLYITTQIDGYKVGEAIFRNYNRRTGGGLSG